MAYRVPTPDEMLGFLVALFKSLLPDRNIGSRFAPAWKLMKTITGAVTDVHAHVDTAFKDVMPDSAAKTALDRWLKIIAPGGTAQRKGATPARKSKSGRVKTGGAGGTTTIGDQLVHRASGLLFQINQTITIGANTFSDVDIVAVDVGAKTRLQAGEVLEYLAPPAGIQTQVVLQLALDEDGFDAEQDGSGRNRLLAALSAPAAGGNQSDYVAWGRAQLGIAAAFCYPNRAGLGTVDVALLHSGTGTARILTAGEVTTNLTALQKLAPAQVGGTGGSLRVLTVIGGNTDAANLANVEMTVTPNGDPQYQMDWDDTAGPATVLAWTAATRTLQFTGGTRPSTMKAKDRIVFKGVATLQDGTPIVIEALGGAADTVILSVVPTVAPANTDLVYAAGPLTKPIRDAILAHINGDVLLAGPAGPQPGSTAASTVNLQVLADGIGTANPAGLYGAWVGALLVGTLAKIATYTKGVRKQTVITPAADQEAVDYAFPNDAQIGLLTPGYVLVRRG